MGELAFRKIGEKTNLFIGSGRANSDETTFSIGGVNFAAKRFVMALTLRSSMSGAFMICFDSETGGCGTSGSKTVERIDKTAYKLTQNGDTVTIQKKSTSNWSLFNGTYTIIIT